MVQIEDSFICVLKALIKRTEIYNAWPVTWGEREPFAKFLAHSLKSNQGRKWEKQLSFNERLMARNTRYLFILWMLKKKKKSLRTLTTNLPENVCSYYQWNNWPECLNHECGLLTSQIMQGYFLWPSLITDLQKWHCFVQATRDTWCCMLLQNTSHVKLS